MKLTELVKYDAMCRAIDAAYEVDEVKDIHDKASALELYERLAKNVAAEDRCYQIRWRAATKAGELLKVQEKARRGPDKEGGGHSQRSENSTSEPKTLSELGISKQQSSDWQKLASVPKDQFEAALAAKSVRELIAKPSPVDGDALAVQGSLKVETYEKDGVNKLSLTVIAESVLALRQPRKQWSNPVFGLHGLRHGFPGVTLGTTSDRQPFLYGQLFPKGFEIVHAALGAGDTLLRKGRDG